MTLVFQTSSVNAKRRRFKDQAMQPGPVREEASAATSERKGADSSTTSPTPTKVTNHEGESISLGILFYCYFVEMIESDVSSEYLIGRYSAGRYYRACYCFREYSNEPVNFKAGKYCLGYCR